MDPKAVEKLESKVEEAITEVVLRLGLKKLPLLPSHRTFQMMAKAAVAVYLYSDTAGQVAEPDVPETAE